MSHFSSPGTKNTITLTVRHHSIFSPSEELHVAPVLHVGHPAECLLSALFSVAAKKKEEEEERARKEKAEKGVALINFFCRLQADLIMTMSVGSEG